MLSKLYNKFDKMQEPYRLLTFLGIFTPIIASNSWFMHTNQFEYVMIGWLILGFFGVTKAAHNMKK